VKNTLKNREGTRKEGKNKLYNMLDELFSRRLDEIVLSRVGVTTSTTRFFFVIFGVSLHDFFAFVWVATFGFQKKTDFLFRKPRDHSPSSFPHFSQLPFSLLLRQLLGDFSF